MSHCRSMYSARGRPTASLPWKAAHMFPKHLRGPASGGSKHLRRRDGCWVGRDLMTSWCWRLGLGVLVKGIGGQVMSKTLIIMAVGHRTDFRLIVPRQVAVKVIALEVREGGMEGQRPSSTRLRPSSSRYGHKVQKRLNVNERVQW